MLLRNMASWFYYYIVVNTEVYHEYWQTLSTALRLLVTLLVLSHWHGY